MTFREKLKQEHLECIDPRLVSGCKGCPPDYGYEPEFDCGSMPCSACWDLEMPMTPEEQEANDLAINAEIIRAYCVRETACVECPAFHICSTYNGSWHADSENHPNCYQISAAKQRAMLDAFENALPPLDEEIPAAPREIPQTVRKLVDARIQQLTEQVKALEAERDVLCDFLNGNEMAK